MSLDNLAGTLDNLAGSPLPEAVRRLGLLGPLNAVVDIDSSPIAVRSGPLAAVPVAIKNIIDVAGLPTRMGSPAPARPSVADAELVRRLRSAGALVVATTQCLEWAAGFAHPQVGDTRNPYDLTLTAGGSSGGSAAVVAAGAVPLAVGTDTGGSIRIPAAYCGVPGIKPTTGLVPLTGVQALSPTLDCAGVFAGTAAELWPALAIMAGLAITPLQPLGRALILGVLEDQFADASVVESGRFAAALSQLAAAGVELRPLRGGWMTRPVELLETLTVIVAREAAEVHRDRDPSIFATGTRALVELGETVTPSELTGALVRRTSLMAQIDVSLNGVDALIGPTVGFVAPAENPPFGADDDTEALFTGPYNLSGHPAISLPVGGGPLPIGLQLAGRRDSDHDLINIAAQVERILGTFPRPEAMT